MRYDVRLAGVGGQGLILAGMMLGEAACLHSGLHAVQTQTYAPLVRGAPSMSEVIISEAPIDFPALEKADLLLALVQHSWDAYAAKVRPQGLVVVPERGVELGPLPTGVQVLQLPLYQMATEAGAPPICVTVVGMGALVAARGVLLLPALREAVRSRVPREACEANLRALEAGFAAGEQSRLA